MTLPFEDLGLASPQEARRHDQGLDWPTSEDGRPTESETLEGLLRSGALVQDGAESLYAYRIEAGPWGRGTGIVCAVAVEDYLNRTIATHEQTREDIERTRAAHTLSLGVQTGPVLLAYPDQPEVARILAGACDAATPLIDEVDALGARNRVWRLDDETSARLTAAMGHVRRAYIADGHHRAASSVAVAQARGGLATRFLATLFPASTFELGSCNRVVAGACAGGLGRLMDSLGDLGLEARQLEGRPRTRRGYAYLYARGTWLEVGPMPARETGPLAHLDAALAQRLVMEPVLGVHDIRHDPRVSFIGAAFGLEGVERACSPEDVGLALHPAGIDEVMAIADLGLTMPPKSTWFEPKPRGGLFARRI